MTILQAAATEILSKYDDSAIVVGIIICFTLMVGFVIVYDKYFKTKFDLSKLQPAQINISSLDAIKITQGMLQKALDEVTVDGHTAAKRISKFQHDNTEALSNSSDMSTLAVEINATNKELVAELKAVNINMSEFYKSQGEKTDKFNKTVLDLLIKDKSNTRK